jgi:putative aldouronate transport system substrate-binding protein
VAPEQTIGRDWHFAINKNTKRLDEVLALLNWMYDTDVQAYLMNGPEGLIWEVNSAREPLINETPERKVIYEKNSEPHMPASLGGGAFRDGVFAFNTLGLQASVPMSNGYTLGYRYWPSYLNRNRTQLDLEKIARLGAWKTEEYVAPRGQKADSTQAVSMITPVSGDLEMIVVQIGEVVKKYSWQMVYASNQAQFNSLWNQMKADANSLGLAQVNQYYTNEWNRVFQLVSQYE